MSNPHYPVALIASSPEDVRDGIKTALNEYPILCSCHANRQQEITMNPTLIDVLSLPDSWRPAVEYFAKKFGPDWALLMITLYELSPNKKWPKESSIFSKLTKNEFLQRIVDSMHNIGSLIEIDNEELCLQIHACCT